MRHTDKQRQQLLLTLLPDRGLHSDRTECWGGFRNFEFLNPKVCIFLRSKSPYSGIMHFVCASPAVTWQGFLFPYKIANKAIEMWGSGFVFAQKDKASPCDYPRGWADTAYKGVDLINFCSLVSHDHEALVMVPIRTLLNTEQRYAHAVHKNTLEVSIGKLQLTHCTASRSVEGSMVLLCPACRVRNVSAELCVEYLVITDTQRKKKEIITSRRK